jgi:hypothetical protein
VAFGVKLEAPPFRPYPASYGDNGVRFASDAAWLAWNGLDVRGGNVHGDPGAFPWARLVALTGQETDMPLTDDDAIKVARAVHAQKLFGSDVTIGKALYDTYQRPVAPSAAEIAAAIVVAFKALPAGTATVDDATIAKVARPPPPNSPRGSSARPDASHPSAPRGGAPTRGADAVMTHLSPLVMTAAIGPAAVSIPWGVLAAVIVAAIGLVGSVVGPSSPIGLVGQRQR